MGGESIRDMVERVESGESLERLGEVLAELPSALDAVISEYRVNPVETSVELNDRFHDVGDAGDREMCACKKRGSLAVVEPGEFIDEGVGDLAHDPDPTGAGFTLTVWVLRFLLFFALLAAAFCAGYISSPNSTVTVQGVATVRGDALYTGGGTVVGVPDGLYETESLVA